MRILRRGRKYIRTRHKRIFAALLLGAAVCLLLPAPLTRWMMNLVQVLVPFQDAATRASDSVSDAVSAAVAPPVPRAEHESTLARNQALEHTVTALRTKIDGLERTNQELAAIRRGGMPGRLIPARVVAREVLAWRESDLLDAGTLRGIRASASVISDHFAVNLGVTDGAAAGQAVLAAEVFVGTIEYAGTHTARVRRVTDPATRMAVLVAPPDHGPLDAEFWLVGAGGGEARIQDVDHRYVKNKGGIEVGHRVLTPRDDERLPVSMVIGTVSAIEPDPRNPLLFSLTVCPAVEPDRLRRVYVVDPLPSLAGG